MGLTNNLGKLSSIITSTGSAVGIAQPSPSYTLDVSGTIRGTTSAYFATTSGNVGIGTSSPTAIAAYKSLTLDGVDGSIIDLRFNGSGNGRVFTSSDTAVGLESLSTTLPLIFKTQNGSGSTERMRITSGGDVIIGNAPAATNVSLDINGVINKAGRIRFQESGSSKWIMGNGAASENGRFEIYDNVNGTGVQLLRGATSWTALSDERFKDIIEPISVNDKLKDVRAIIGKYKTDNEGVRRNFLIAQDLLKVFPEVVDVDEDETKPMGVRYQDLIPILVKAIQEQNQTIQSLQERITKAGL